MRNVVAIVLLVVCGCLVGPALAGAAAPAHGPFTVSQAHHAYLDAQRAADEAKRVWESTQRYSRQYGPSVGRWVHTARVAGWGWGAAPALIAIVWRESRGQNLPPNYASAAGPLQEVSGWYGGRWPIRGHLRHWNPADAFLDFFWGHGIWLDQGGSFSPAWAATAAVQR